MQIFMKEGRKEIVWADEKREETEDGKQIEEGNGVLSEINWDK